MALPNYETVVYEKSESIATITLNRPEVLNAVNEQLGSEPQDAVSPAVQSS